MTRIAPFGPVFGPGFKASETMPCALWAVHAQRLRDNAIVIVDRGAIHTVAMPLQSRPRGRTKRASRRPHTFGPAMLSQPLALAACSVTTPDPISEHLI